MINVTLIYKGQTKDLRFSAHTTLHQLKALLRRVFKENKTSLPEHFLLRLTSKPLNLAEYDWLDEFPIGNGDVFEILELEA